MNWGRWTFVAIGLIALCFFLLACASASGEPAPSASVPSYSSSLRPVIAAAQGRISLPEQGRPHLLDGALYASIATYRTLDYFSTRRALAGAREVVLPQWVVNNRGTFIAFEGLATASEIGGSVWLIRHGHRRMARAANAMSIGLGVQAVVNNYTEPLVFAR